MLIIRVQQVEDHYIKSGTFQIRRHKFRSTDSIKQAPIKWVSPRTGGRPRRRIRDHI
jgi:hypothetical protein